MSDQSLTVSRGVEFLSQGDLIAVRRLCEGEICKETEALILEGGILLKQGRCEEASRTLQKAYDGGVRSEFLLRHLVLSLDNCGRLEETLPILEELQALFPKETFLPLWWALYYERAEKHDEAEQFFRRAAALNPKGTAAWEGLERVFRSMGREDDALRIAKRLGRKEADGLVLKGPRATAPIFIIGAGHSGTTLLHRLLAKHADLLPTLGEPGQEDQVGWQKFGGAVISGTGDDGEQIGFPFNVPMAESDAKPETIENMHRYYFDCVLARDESKRVVNKNPAMANKISFIRAIFPDAKFIHVVRDVVPFAGSWKRSLDLETRNVVFYWPEGEGMNCWFLPYKEVNGQRLRSEVFAHQDRFYPGGGFFRLSEYWASLNAGILDQQRRHPDTILTVRYEDICRNLHAELRRIFEFLELPAKLADLEEVRSANEKSEAYLTEEEKALCRDGAGETMRRLGY